MKIRGLCWKQTASKCINNKCSLCREYIDGEEGFIFMRGVRTGYSWASHPIRICWKCMKGCLKESYEKRKDKKKTYRLLAKRVILNRLK